VAAVVGKELNTVADESLEPNYIFPPCMQAVHLPDPSGFPIRSWSERGTQQSCAANCTGHQILWRG
jgi:hypothetical protein